MLSARYAACVLAWMSVFAACSDAPAREEHDAAVPGDGDAAVPGDGAVPDAISAEQAFCEDLPPGTPIENRARIQACLDAPWGHAWLRPGVTYELDGALVIDAGDVLRGQSDETYAIVQPAEASAPFETISNAILNVVNSTGAEVGGTLQNVTLDLRDARPTSGRTIYGVRIAYDHNLVERVEVTSTPMPWRAIQAVSLYFGTGAGNRAIDVDLHDAAFGVVFLAGNTEAMSPWVDRARIHHNRGDAVTFAGYGKITNSVISENGWDDGDSNSGTRLPPGGALYASHVNQEGGWIEGNRIYDQCGTNLELNMTRNFTVIDNTIYHPGWPGKNGTSSLIRPGEYSYQVPDDFCKAAMSALLIGISDSVFRNNEILNHGRAANTTASTSNGGSEEWFGPGKVDLPVPDGTSIAVALVLGRTHTDSAGGVHYATNNEFVGNYLASFGAGAAGLGWFVGRDVGFGPGGTWDAATTANVFDDNSHCNRAGTCSPSPYSVRCGDNRYGTGVATCRGDGGENLFDGVGAGNACNRDDFTHEGAANDVRRNDGCPHY